MNLHLTPESVWPPDCKLNGLFSLSNVARRLGNPGMQHIQRLSMQELSNMHTKEKQLFSNWL